MEQDKYYKRSLILLYDIVKQNGESLTKEQCKVIGECYQLLNKEHISKDDFNHIDNILMDVVLNWLDTSPMSLITEVLVEMQKV